MAFKDTWYHARTQVIFVGCVALCCPGMFNALGGLGKAGGKNAHAANMANASLYACFAVFGYFGGFFFNILGPRILIAVGSIFYAIYAAGMYVSGNVDGAGWVAILVGALLGFGAGWFWTAQGAMTIAYATPSVKGEYIGIFWIIFNLGGTLGGLIEFGVNYNSAVDQASSSTYWVFCAIMLFGSVGSVFLIVNPKKVIREDGEMVVFDEQLSPKVELKNAFMVITDKYMILLSMLFLGSNFYYTYQFNFVNGSLFNSRTRGLNSAIYWAFQMLSAYLMSKVVDIESAGPRRRGWYGFIFVSVSFAIAWAIGIWVEYGFEGGYDKDHPCDPLIDFKDSSRAAGPIVALCWYGLGDAALQAYALWLMGAIAGPDTNLSARYAGYYKGIQSVGACIAWGIDLSPSVTYEIEFWVGFAIFVAAMPLAGLVVKDLPRVQVEHDEEEGHTPAREEIEDKLEHIRNEEERETRRSSSDSDAS